MGAKDHLRKNGTFFSLSFALAELGLDQGKAGCSGCCQHRRYRPLPAVVVARGRGGWPLLKKQKHLVLTRAVPGHTSVAAEPARRPRGGEGHRSGIGGGIAAGDTEIGGSNTQPRQ